MTKIKLIKSVLIILSLILFGELCFYAGMEVKSKPVKIRKNERQEKYGIKNTYILTLFNLEKMNNHMIKGEKSETATDYESFDIEGRIFIKRGIKYPFADKNQSGI